VSLAILLCAGLLATATSTSATTTPQLLVLEPAVVKVGVGDARLLQRMLVQELARAEGLDVIGSADLQRLADLSAMQSSAGCDDGGGSCLAEIADAMGAGLVVFSEVGRLGGRVIWQLGLWDQERSRIVARATVEDADVAGLGRRVDDAVAVLLAPLADRGVRYAPHGASPLVPVGAVVTGGGALALVGGAVGLAVGAVVVGDASYDTGLRRDLQAAGPVLVAVTAVGAAVAAVGGGLWVAGALQSD
jgi:hypothetical protein